MMREPMKDSTNIPLKNREDSFKAEDPSKRGKENVLLCYSSVQ
jgi:hypothetical protein